MNNSLLQSVSLLAVFSSCLLAVFLFTVQTERRVANGLLGAFILLNAVDISSWITHQTLSQYPRLLMFKITLNFLVNPCFYLYVVAVCYTDFRLSTRHLWHLLPFALMTAGLLPRFYLADNEAQLQFLRQYSLMPEATLGRLLSQLQFVVYMFAVFRTLARYQRTYVENYADSTSRTYYWLFRLAVILTGLHVVVFAKELLRYTAYQSLFHGLESWVGLNATVLLSWWLLQALQRPYLFRSIDSRLETVAELLTATGEASENAPLPVAVPVTELTLPAAQAQASARLLRDHMEKARPYLDPELTIQNLAKQLQVPVRELSLLINHHLNQHFFDFINGYRIRQSMQLLRDPTQRSRTVLEILYAVGFNSKSSFNTAFKKLTGQTPTQYREGLKRSTRLQDQPASELDREPVDNTTY